MRKILLPVDGSLSSQFAAAHAAKRVRSGEHLELQLLNVQYRPHVHAGLGKIVSAAMINEYATEQGNAALKLAAAVLDEAHVPYQTQIAFGDPGHVIAEHTATDSYAEIVMGTRGTSVLAGLFIGSVATKVIQLVDVPVTLVPVPTLTFHQTGRATPENAEVIRDPGARSLTLILVDGSEQSHRAVEHVIAQAQRGIVSDLVLLNVQPPYPTTGTWNPISPEAIADAHQQEGIKKLASAQARLMTAGLAARSSVAVGETAETIARVAKDLACDRIVMGTRGMGATGNLLFGSTAQRVLHLVEVPVTMVK